MTLLTLTIWINSISFYIQITCNNKNSQCPSTYTLNLSNALSLILFNFTTYSIIYSSTKIPTKDFNEPYATAYIFKNCAITSGQNLFLLIVHN